jgi:glutathione S-transferase
MSRLGPATTAGEDGMKLYFHPLSTYSQKTLVALYEKGVSFEPQLTDIMNPEARAEYQRLYPLAKLPLLQLPDGHLVPESSIIIEYLDTHFEQGTRLIPEDRDLARRTRFHDRQFDLYVNDPFQKIFFDGFRPVEKRDPDGVAAARSRLDQMYRYFDHVLSKNTWLLGDVFTMADCAAVPLAWLAHVHPYAEYPHLVAYSNRLSERPSVARVLSEAAPHVARLTGR